VTMESFATAVWPEQPVVAAGPVRPPTRTAARPRAGASADAPTEVTAAPTTPLPAARGAPRSSKTGVLVGAALVAVAAVGGFLVFGRGTESPAPESQPPSPPAARVDTVRVSDTVRVPQRPSGFGRREPVPVPSAGRQGYVTVNAEPYGEVYVDGVDVGPTPVVRYAVPPGVHTIKVVRAGYRTVTERVDVDAGNTVPKRYTLLPEG